MTAVEQEIDVFTALTEDLDLTPPCEYQYYGHTDIGQEPTVCPRPAVWVMRLRVGAKPCGCPFRRPLMLLCDECYKHYVSTGRSRCGTCGKTYPTSAIVLSVEPLR